MPLERLEYKFDRAFFVACERAIDAIVEQERRRSHITAMRHWIVNQYETEDEEAFDREGLSLLPDG